MVGPNNVMTDMNMNMHAKGIQESVMVEVMGKKGKECLALWRGGRRIVGFWWFLRTAEEISEIVTSKQIARHAQ